MSNPTISIVFPWRAGDPEREASMQHTVKWYKDCFPEAEIVFADDDDQEHFNRGRALNHGVAKSTGEVLILADADLIIAHKTLRNSVARAHEFGMIIPFSGINYMNQSATRKILNGSPPFVNYAGITPFMAKSQGGCNIMTRLNWERSGGFDTKFRGWGFEDAAFSVNVRLYAGPLYWEPGCAVHLYHRSARNVNNGLYDKSQTLCKEYEKALENAKVVPSKEDKNYCIKPGYKANYSAAEFDDTKSKDEFQKEVYLEAKRLMEENGWTSVIDVGCGSGYKLVNYLGEYETLGTDLPRTLAFLKEKYPDRTWKSALEDYSNLSTNLVICSDVIEHVDKPDEFVNKLLDIECNMFLISSPERDLVRGPNDYGPPTNACHYREWNTEEFKGFLSLWFKVEDLKVVNNSQGTMLAWLTRKRDLT